MRAAAMSCAVGVCTDSRCGLHVACTLLSLINAVQTIVVTMERCMKRSQCPMLNVAGSFAEEFAEAARTLDTKS